MAGGACEYLDLCQSFSDVDGNCADCYNITTFDNTTNSSFTREYCSACQVGFYLFGDTYCISCPDTCFTCTSPLSCLLCQPTLTLSSGSCECNPYDN
jgi:hypothetical protein